MLRPEINEATIRLLTRHGCEVVVAKGAGCCGAIFHQLGIEERAKAAAKANIAAWSRVSENGGLDAIVFNASGCGVALKEYASGVGGTRSPRLGAMPLCLGSAR